MSSDSLHTDRRRTPRKHTGPLSPMQRAVAMMHAGGVPSKRGADVMRISQHTYLSHLKRAVKRLGMAARGDRIRLAAALASAYSTDPSTRQGVGVTP